jgi:hypothetical protein
VPSVGSAVSDDSRGDGDGDLLPAGLRRRHGQIVEANEVNNCRAAAGTVAVAPATADYVVTALSEPPATAAASSGFTVTDTTQNAGTAAPRRRRPVTTCRPTPCVTVPFLLSGCAAVPALARALRRAVAHGDDPATTPVGPYYLLACADDTAAIPETNENNNCRASAGTVQVTPASADLVVSSVEDPSANTMSGGSFRVTDITRNVGAANAGRRRRASTCRSIRYGREDVLLTGARGIGRWRPAVLDGHGDGVHPSGTPAGTYYLLACADDLGAVNETNEANNCVASDGRRSWRCRPRTWR